MVRQMVLAIEIETDPKAIYDAIATRSGLASFWTSDVLGDEGEGEELTFGFPGAPSRLPMQVMRLQEPSAVEWRSGGDWPFWDGTVVQWSLGSGDTGTNVILQHAGWAEETPDFAFGSVALTWGMVLGRLKQVLESGGKPDPMLG